MRVLGLFGRAFSKLPDSSSQWTKDQQDFVRQAVAGLAQDRKVVSVRLALFAEMMKSRDWTPEALKEVGGTEGVGATFLEETFSSRTAPPQHRHHQTAARAVLAVLLPDSTTDIKGQMRSQAELQEAAGYQHRPSDFRELMRTLDSELRLITPTDVLPDSPGEPEASASGFVRSQAVRSGFVTSGLASSGFNTTGSVENNPPADAGGSPTDNSPGNNSPRCYQLTHDYLVPSLRDWLTRKQRETRTGRAELKLAERTALWTAKPENRHLPSLTEWMNIRWLVKRNRWSETQQRMMRRAGRHHVGRTAVLVLCFLLAGATVQFILAGQKAASLVESLKTASPEQLIPLVEQADKTPRSLDRLLRPLIEQGDAANADAAAAAVALPARLVLVKHDVAQIKPLSEMLLAGDLDFVEPIRNRLQPHADVLRPQWIEVLRNERESAPRRFRAALGLVGMDGDASNKGWHDADLYFVAEQLTSSFAEYQPQLRNLLRPIGLRLVPALDTLFDSETATADQQINATMALADYAGDNGELMAQLLIRATAQQTEILYPKVAEFRSGPIRDGLLALTKEQPDENLGQLERVRLGRRRANAAITLLRQGERDAWFDALRITDDPESLSQFVARCQKWGVTPEELLESLQRSTAIRQSASGAAKTIESRVMYGLLLALGSYAVDQIPDDSCESLFARLRDLYEKDPSASIHSASGWLLRHWGRGDDVHKDG